MAELTRGGTGGTIYQDIQPKFDNFRLVLSNFLSSIMVFREKAESQKRLQRTVKVDYLRFKR